MNDPVLMDQIVYDVDRCPHCGVASPLLSISMKPQRHYRDSNADTWWHFAIECSRCHRHALCYGSTAYGETPDIGGTPTLVRIRDIYPSVETASEQLPEKPKKFFQQALESRHAPDGALMLAASAIDSMLKDKGYKDGSLFSRIELASNDGLLTKEMRDWAHEIRLSANEPRHADDDYDGATVQDVDQIIEFVKALTEYLYVLPSKVSKWKGAAQPSSQS
ncbi:hypothetical protein GGC65_001869 [Sphingopyxis sp. OAS728]|uniref:DUF4145 domain-containing protein n=1 Tax=Sphingopyxis sp. OAS728 TaxID=2663823 RepID=UPI00178BA04C|nr:DUF4145 domain-containing protein [Sphingopyxis sp. OAS728]MBE1527413.1 hypothetical protein [Sphingopyxis sp. OAS728]